MTLLFLRCSNQHDPELETPDVDANGMSHGTDLTQLGCFVYLPWQYFLRSDSDSLYNVRVVSGDKEIYSKGYSYTPQEADFVFQLFKDKTLKYWLKRDYIHSPIDTAADGAIIKHGVAINKANIKNIYEGNWTFNHIDSTFKLNFNDNKMLLPSISGKYLDLGSKTMSYQNISIFDSMINGRVLTLKKISTKYLTH